VPDVQIFSGKKVAAPSTYVIPDSAEFILKCVNADFDGSGAAGDYLPCVSIVSSAGEVIARAVDQGVKVIAGSDAEVSWFPRLKRKGAAAGPSARACQLLGSGNGNTTLTITLTKAVPATGTLQVVFAQVSIPDGVDGGSQPTAGSDSQGHGPWRIPTIPNDSPVIPLSRQTDPGNTASLQVGSVARACVAADLGIGDTCTVTFSSVAPANFHTTGLVIYQPAYFFSSPQNGFAWGNVGDAHPDFGASFTRFSWDDDYIPPWSNNDRDSHRITAIGAYPPVAGFVPFSGSKIGEIASGSCSIASACQSICQGTMPDPGGTFPAGASLLAGNYQVAMPRTCSTP
jgi:hypothetical protein